MCGVLLARTLALIRGRPGGLDPKRQERGQVARYAAHTRVGGAGVRRARRRVRSGHVRPSFLGTVRSPFLYLHPVPGIRGRMAGLGLFYQKSAPALL